MNRFTWMRTVAAVGAAALALSACGGGGDSTDAGSDSTIRVGAVLSLTGPAAGFGLPAKEALDIIAKKLNKDGGVDGRKIKLFIKDDKTDPTEAARLARSLILDDEVSVIVGATTGSASMALGPIAAANKVPVLAPNNTISVTDKKSGFYDWIFRLGINDLLTVEKAFDLAKSFGAKKVGIFYQEDAYGEATKDRAVELAKDDDDVDIVVTAAAPLSATDTAVQATRIKNANPDAVLLQASAQALGSSIVRALKQVRYEGQIIVPIGLTTDAFIDGAAGDAEGIEALGGFGLDKPVSDGQKEFLATLEESGYGPPKGFGEVLGGTATNALVAAIKKADGDYSGESMRDAIESVCYDSLFPGPEVCFSKDNHDGASVENGAHERVEKGKWVTVE